MRVLKYKLEIADHQVVKLPSNSVILSVINQREDIVMYVQVDDEETTTRDVDIFIHGTGHEMNQFAEIFLGTVALMGGGLVFHVFGKRGQLYFNDVVCIKKVIPPDITYSEKNIQYSKR